VRTTATQSIGTTALHLKEPRAAYCTQVECQHNKAWRAIVKAVEDRLFSAVLLAAMAPMMTVIAVLIKLDSRGPIFFVQPRFGYRSKVINVIKFRTMHADRADYSGAQRTIPNDPRVTRVGRILRLLSLDEIPQLFNVLRGDMSLIGPRPHAVSMKVAGSRLYSEAVDFYHLRHLVKPGITGLAQVNGSRGEVDTLYKAHARIVYDLYYIEHWSARMDMKILLKTVGILLSEGAY